MPSVSISVWIAEVAHAALEQQRADGVRHRADADLQAAAVLDLGRDQLRHGTVDVGGRRIRDLGRSVVAAVDDVVDLALVHRVLEAVEIGQPG